MPPSHSRWIARAPGRLRPWLAGLGPRQRVARFLVVVRAGAIASVTLAAIVAIGEASGVAFLASSLGSTVIVAYVFPESPFARPRTILAGHAVATLVGLAVALALGPSPYGAALAVGLSIAAMQATRTMQPPAGGDPILVAAGGADPVVAAVSVMVGAVVVAAGAWAWRRNGPGSRGSDA